MTIGSYLFGIGLALITGVYIARPFIKRSTTPRSTPQAGRRRQLLVQKAALYAAIREIDTDVQLGKLELADHRVLRQRYVTEGVAVLRALDGLPAPDEIDAAIEADVTSLRDGRRPASPGPSPAGAETAERRCPACDGLANADDLFCARCGARLEGGGHETTL
jgi:hypothetical protein